MRFPKVKGRLLLVSFASLVLVSCGPSNGVLKREIEGRGSSNQTARAQPQTNSRFSDVTYLTSAYYDYRAFFQKGGTNVTEAVLNQGSTDYDSFVVAIPAAGIQDQWKLRDNRLLKDVVVRLLTETYRQMANNKDASLDLNNAFQEALSAFTNGVATPFAYDLGQTEVQYQLVISPARGISTKDPQQLFLRIEIKKKPK